MLASEKLAESLSAGTHAATFGGNPLSSAAGVATLTSLLSDGVLEHCSKMGEHFILGLERLKARHPVIRHVRGRGLVLGVELTVKAKPVVDKCIDKGFLIHYTKDTVLRFHPPLTIRKKEIDMLLEALDEVLSTEVDTGS
jgi:acetylornithine/succinyldiaminopimelate/putrescine aminotransferase